MGDDPHAKERRLKKYEASAQVCATAAGDPPLDLALARKLRHPAAVLAQVESAVLARRN